jgi:raffinose/stachyose/melibiose transport system substrate-binding protein
MKAGTHRARIATLASAVAFALGLNAASAQTRIELYHPNADERTQEIWKQAARDFEAEHNGVEVVIQYIEGEAFKTKMPTLLQSSEKPEIIYTWGGGVMRAQIEAGFLQDVTDQVTPFLDRFSDGAVAAFNVDGKFYGVPMLFTQVAFFYNKPLAAKLGVDPETIKTWSQFLDAVKKIKAAGEVPIVIPAGPKWPAMFYWASLVLRNGGPEAIVNARTAENGFVTDGFINAGRNLQELAALDPFQDGHLAAQQLEAAGQFGDGTGVFQLMGNWIIERQRTNSKSGKGLSDDELGVMQFPVVESGAGNATATLGGINGWLITRDSPPEAVQFVEFLMREKYQKQIAEKALYIPANKGADKYITSPVLQQIAASLAASTYHQIFFDQDFTPSVGGVMNDVSVQLIADDIMPEGAAEAVQEAWEFR